jgi:uncharacterized protein (DUF488 family)
MAAVLYTIGYEGQSVKSFLAVLKEHSIECVLDVRALPLSRKKGFSKNTLKKHLETHAIAYVHLPDLGSPKEVRDNVKATGDYKTFFEAMEKHLADQEEALEEACRHVQQSVCCLLCFEKDPQQCHRSLVAQKIKERTKNTILKNL